MPKQITAAFGSAIIMDGEYFERTSQSTYKSAKVKMPKPELYIAYTGNKGKKPDTIDVQCRAFPLL